MKSFFSGLGSCIRVGIHDILAVLFFLSTGLPWNTISFTVDVAILTCKPACLSRCCCSLILTLIIFIFSSIMDSFESSPTITFIQVDYDPALIPSSWTVFSAGVFLKTLSSHCVFDSLYRSIQREARRCSPTK